MILPRSAVKRWISGHAILFSDAQSECDTMVDALLAQATKQSGSGSPSSALALVEQSLTCKQDPRIVQIAATYACDAHYPTTAQRYYSMLSSTSRSAIKDRCAKNHITLVP